MDHSTGPALRVAALHGEVDVSLDARGAIGGAGRFGCTAARLILRTTERGETEGEGVGDDRPREEPYTK
jgi:hypothetical protein